MLRVSEMPKIVTASVVRIIRAKLFCGLNIPGGNIIGGGYAPGGGGYIIGPGDIIICDGPGPGIGPGIGPGAPGVGPGEPMGGPPGIPGGGGGVKAPRGSIGPCPAGG